jgi:MinD-like ATPase involved in chromosome partitioning or flagellar assembly
MPEDMGYELPEDKSSSLNYLIDMIDKGMFTEYNFEKCLRNKKECGDIDIIAGNTSLNICLNILNHRYYEKILEIAKLKFDVIFLDVSSSMFLDSTQFSVCNATDIFFVIEANILSIERAKRTLKNICENWNVDEKKIKILVNKYQKNSLEKELIKELLREYEVVGFIPYSDDVERLINEENVNIPKSIKEELEFLSSDMGVTKKIKLMDKLFLR